MKTTRLGTYLDTFVGQFKFWANKYDIPYLSLGFEPLENDMLTNYKIRFGNLQVFNDVTSTAYVNVHNNRLGYGDFVMLSRNNGKDLLAVEIIESSNDLIFSISSLMIFNGVPIKKILTKNGSHLIVFDY